MSARRAVRVVVVVRPAEAEALLAGVLDLARFVPSHPVLALGGEEQVAGIVHAEGSRRCANPRKRLLKTLLVRNRARASSEGSSVLFNQGCWRGLSGTPAAIPMTLANMEEPLRQRLQRRPS